MAHKDLKLLNRHPMTQKERSKCVPEQMRKHPPKQTGPLSNLSDDVLQCVFSESAIRLALRHKQRMTAVCPAAEIVPKSNYRSCIQADIPFLLTLAEDLHQATIIIDVLTIHSDGFIHTASGREQKLHKRVLPKCRAGLPQSLQLYVRERFPDTLLKSDSFHRTHRVPMHPSRIGQVPEEPVEDDSHAVLSPQTDAVIGFIRIQECNDIQVRHFLQFLPAVQRKCLKDISVLLQRTFAASLTFLPTKVLRYLWHHLIAGTISLLTTSGSVSCTSTR